MLKALGYAPSSTQLTGRRKNCQETIKTNGEEVMLEEHGFPELLKTIKV